jgi:hypothetical protein
LICVTIFQKETGVAAAATADVFIENGVTDSTVLIDMKTRWNATRRV